MTKIIDSPTMKMAVDTLDDIERVRIASENRLRALTRDEADEDGELRGLGLDESHPDVAMAKSIVDGLAALEAQQVKVIQKLMKKHPLSAWVANSKGVGAKQGARLIAAIGDPLVAERVNKTTDGKIVSIDTGERTLREFLSYTGYGIDGDGMARRRKKGERSNWNVTAKMRAYLIANSVVKTTGPLREVYDAARSKYNEAVHATDCVRCGPSGKPAPAGSLLSPGHAHARAVRAVAKRVLTDLYDEAQRVHAEVGE
jgi:hypothetical protein